MRRRSLLSEQPSYLCAPVYIYIYIYIYTRACKLVRMYDFMYVCKYECVHVCVRTCLLYVCICTMYMYLFVTNKEVGCIFDRNC